MHRRTLLAAFLAFPAAAHAHSFKIGAIAVGHAWALPSQPPDGQVFFPMVNNGSAADELIAARSTICSQIELRSNNRYDDPPLASIALQPGKPVAMRPTARHLRLIGLKEQLTKYKSFTIVLDFLKAGEVEIEVLVQPSASD